MCSTTLHAVCLVPEVLDVVAARVVDHQVGQPVLPHHPRRQLHYLNTVTTRAGYKRTSAAQRHTATVFHSRSHVTYVPIYYDTKYSSYQGLTASSSLVYRGAVYHENLSYR